MPEPATLMKYIRPAMFPRVRSGSPGHTDTSFQAPTNYRIFEPKARTRTSRIRESDLGLATAYPAADDKR